MITKNILERALKMLPIASTDVTRYAINGVYINSTENGVTLVATNGRMLMEEKVNGKCPLGKYILRHENKKMAKTVLDECDSFEEIECSIDSKRGLFLGLTHKMSIEKLDTYYPSYETVIPKFNGGTVGIAFNAKYIYELMKAYGQDHSDNVWIEFNPESATSAITVNSSRPDCIAVLMPCRFAETQALAQAMKKERDLLRACKADSKAVS